MVFGLVLIAGLGLAGFAVYMAQNYIGAYETALQKERAKSGGAIAMQKLYVATRDIEYGEPIAKEDYALVSYPKKLVPEGHFNEETPIHVEGEAPRVALRAIEKFEVYRTTKLSDPGGNAGVLTRLKKGQSAVAIKVDVASGVSGFIRPENRVDVYWTGKVSGADGKKQTITRRVLNGIRVIGIDQSSRQEYSENTVARTVTVAGNAEEVAKLQYAQQTGSLSLSLMARDTEIGDEVIAVDRNALLGIDPEITPVTQAPTGPKMCVTRVTRGTERSEVQYPCPEGS
jgi:pilus assembly protein CpaB